MLFHTLLGSLNYRLIHSMCSSFDMIGRICLYYQYKLNKLSDKISKCLAQLLRLYLDSRAEDMLNNK